MERYKVFFYFGLYNPNPFIKPSEEVVVEVKAGATKSEIIQEGLSFLGSYPRIYSTSIVKL